MSTARTPAFATAGGSSSAVATPTVGKEVPAPVLRETSFERLLRKPWFKSFVAGSGFMSDSYDLFVIDTVNNILKLLYGQTPDQKAGVSNAALVGSVLGQVFFGLAGDMLGRRVCFIVTSVLIIVGALGSASATAGGAVDIYLQLCIWRGLLGFGVGGEYPLSATLTSEGAERASRGRAVSAVFSMQGIGKLLGSIVNYAVLAGGSTYYAGGIPLDSAWRFSLAFGAVPALLTCYFRWQIEESDIYKARMAALEADNRDADAAAAADTGSLITTSSSNVNRGRQAKVSLAMLWEYRWVLLGTAGTWFLLDVTFYGQGLMNTTVVQQALTRSGLTGVDALRDAALGALAVVAIALPGYFVAYLLIDKMGRFPMQLMGFVATAILFMILAAAYDPLRQVGGGGLFVFIYGLTYFFSNFGANTTTFIVPSEVFPTRIRATAHGLSAACGKIGATVGNTVLVEIYNMFCDGRNCVSGTAPGAQQGIVSVMWTCCAVCLAGALMTLVLTKETMHATLEEVDAKSKIEAAVTANNAARSMRLAATRSREEAAEKGVSPTGSKLSISSTGGNSPASLAGGNDADVVVMSPLERVQ